MRSLSRSSSMLMTMIHRYIHLLMTSLYHQYKIRVSTQEHLSKEVVSPYTIIFLDYLVRVFKDLSLQKISFLVLLLILSMALVMECTFTKILLLMQNMIHMSAKFIQLLVCYRIVEGFIMLYFFQDFFFTLNSRQSYSMPMLLIDF